MSSDSLFAACKTCSKQISKKARVCPQCGASQGIGIIKWIGIIFIGLFFVGLINTTEKGKNQSTNTATKEPVQYTEPLTKESSIETLQPQEQVRFIDSVTKYVDGLRHAKNELQQSALRSQRKRDITNSLNRYSVRKWIGVISSLQTNTDGKAILSVRISPDIKIKTWNNALSDINDNTLIEEGTSVYNRLFRMSRGQEVEFSGRFFKSDLDAVKETSMTIQGSMSNPEFLFKFTAVNPI